MNDAPTNRAAALVQKLREKAKALDTPVEEGISLARQALNSAAEIGDTELQIECAITLMKCLGKGLLLQERDRMIEDWSKRIEAEGTTDQQADFNNSVAVAHLEKSEYFEALGWVRKSLEQPDRILNQKLLTMLQINAGSCYSHMGASDRAVGWFYEALTNAERLADDNLCSYIHNNLGILHRTLLELDLAIREFKEVEQLAIRTGDEITLAKAYNNLCGAYFYLRNYNTAMEYIQKAQELYTRHNDQNGIHACLTNIGSIYQRSEDYDKALDYFEKALNIATSLNNKHSIANLVKNVADIHLERKEYDQALPLYERSLAIAKEIGALDLQNDLYIALTRYYSESEDWYGAYESQRILTEIKEMLFQGRQRELADELHMKYDVERKDRESLLLRDRNAVLERQSQGRTNIEGDLQDAYAKIKALKSLLPVCSNCLKVRDDKGTWKPLDAYIAGQSESLQPGFCPECMEKQFDQRPGA
jgi:tetratricopeptide (TPR) repeat protein